MNSVPCLPQIGFGTYRLSGIEGERALQEAIRCGYRLIDTAASYGNETTIKRAIRNSEVSRQQLIISGKLWNTKRQYDQAISACKQSLKRLGLEYFDIYLVHWPASPALYANWREINAECWAAMESLYRNGLAKAIGVCNFLPHHLEELAKNADVLPAVNQIELHPGFLRNGIIEYCHEKGIIIEAWSPLGEGTLLRHELLVDIAKKRDRTPAQICLRWCIQHGAIPLPKSVTPERIHKNFDAFSFSLNDEEMSRIDAMPFSGGQGFDPDTITIYE